MDMKLTILGVDVECEDKVLYATEELSREYIKAIKDTKENLEVLSATFFLPFTFVLGVMFAWWVATKLFN